MTRRQLLLAAAPAIEVSVDRRGIEHQTSRVRLRFPSAGLSTQARRDFTALVHQGLRDLEAYLGVRFDAAYFGREQAFYRVSSRIGMSSARGASVRFPLERVRTRSAPYLHETAHVLMETVSRGRAVPAWLGEGFASFVESHVASEYGGYEARVFTQGGNRGVDREAAAHLRSADGRRVELYVGSAQAPPNLNRDRRRTAPPFYVLSQSFVKFLVARLGKSRVIELHSDADPSRAVRGHRADWLVGVRG